MSDEYRHVWLDKDGDVWEAEADVEVYAQYSPFTEHKVVPADAIVIERSALPEVDATGWLSAGDSALDPAEVAMGVEFVRSKARDYLALAEHLDAHPPVDEAQVEALTGWFELHTGFMLSRDQIGALARKAAADGWHKDADR